MFSEIDRILGVNQRFYEALSTKNLLRLEQLWAHADYVRCKHPGARMLSGWDSIRESWRELFTRSIVFTVEAVAADVDVHGPVAVVTCREKISSFTLDGSIVSHAASTNIFKKQRGKWLLIHRHASPLPDGVDKPTL